MKIKAERREKKQLNKKKMRVSGASVKQVLRIKKEKAEEINKYGFMDKFWTK